ncbi:MAG: hypothetical protein K2X11_05715 [Acetobacteraceae bacterium]|nr:hypothetical protein [Acetobacteraceae bacterium]
MAFLSSAPLSGNTLVNALLSGTRWVSTPTTPLTYGFPIRPLEEFRYSADSLFLSSQFVPVGQVQQQAIRHILEGDSPFGSAGFLSYGEVESLAAIAIDEAQFALPDIRFNITAASTTADGFYRDRSGGGDVWFNFAANVAAPTPGNGAWLVHLHNTLHALGLKHPNDAVSGNAAVLPANFDSLEFTVMSLRSVAGAAPGYTSETWGFPQTPMVLDIQALQHLYGPNYRTNAEDTRYSWSPTTGEMSVNGVGQGAPGTNRILLTIWDGGGTDTFDLSNYSTGVSVSLEPGAASVLSNVQLAQIGTSSGAPVLARGNVFNSLLFNGDNRAIIENAIAGGGDDWMEGNSLPNALIGGGGNDLLFGRGGADILFGWSGNDELRGGTSDDVATGDEGNDRIFGEEGNDTANGGIGDDLLAGWLGNDQLGGGAGNDFVFGEQGNDVVWGEDGDDQLDGGSDDDLLFGGAGNDVLRGDTGNDRLSGGAGADQFAFTTGWGIDTVTDGEFGAGGDRLVLIATGFSSFAQLQPNIQYDAATDFTNVWINGASVIRLQGNVTLTSADILFA